jgi:ribosomal protein S18 acetylase RimI-like enzyme
LNREKRLRRWHLLRNDTGACHARAFDTQAEAHVLCGRLWAEDILAFAAFKYHVGNNWGYSIGLGGIRVQVPNEQLAEAREIIRKSRSGEFESDLHELFGDLNNANCPFCGSEHVQKRRPLGQVALAAILTFYATIFPPWTWLYICAHCGRTFRSRYGLIGKAHFSGFTKVFAEVSSSDFEDMRAAGVASELLVALFAEKAKGWVCRIDGVLRGWSIADLPSRSIATLTVDPDFVREGIGEGLHNRAVASLFASGAETIWTSVPPITRAEKFYRAFGWSLSDIDGNGNYRMELTKTAWQQKMTRRRLGFWGRLRLSAET